MAILRPRLLGGALLQHLDAGMVELDAQGKAPNTSIDDFGVGDVLLAQKGRSLRC